MCGIGLSMKLHKHAWSWFRGVVRKPRCIEMVFLAAFVAVLSAGMPAGAVPVSALAGSINTPVLLAGGDVRASDTGQELRVTLAPQHPAVRLMVDTILASGPDVVVEALFLWKAPSGKPVDEATLLVYNTMRGIGSLQGIEYFSASRGRMRLFYEYSSLIAGPDDPTPVSDADLRALPGTGETLYARQKDLSFGDNRYRIELAGSPGQVTQLSTNLTTMTYLFMPVVSPERMRVALVALVVDEGILFYALSSARAAVIPGIRGKMEASFGNRAAAVYDWFARQAATRW